MRRPLATALVAAPLFVASLLLEGPDGVGVAEGCSGATSVCKPSRWTSLRLSSEADAILPDVPIDVEVLADSDCLPTPRGGWDGPWGSGGGTTTDEPVKFELFDQHDEPVPLRSPVTLPGAPPLFTLSSWETPRSRIERVRLEPAAPLAPETLHTIKTSGPLSTTLTFTTAGPTQPPIALIHVSRTTTSSTIEEVCCDASCNRGSCSCPRSVETVCTPLKTEVRPALEISAAAQPGHHDELNISTEIEHVAPDGTTSRENARLLLSADRDAPGKHCFTAIAENRRTGQIGRSEPLCDDLVDNVSKQTLCEGARQFVARCRSDTLNLVERERTRVDAAAQKVALLCDDTSVHPAAAGCQTIPRRLPSLDAAATLCAASALLRYLRHRKRPSH